MKIRGKNILITAGPTWVAIDRVRVISNIATGRTGIILANKLSRLGAKVTLLLGAAGQAKFNHRIGIKRYSFFDELQALLKKELLTKKYDVVIHSAAVSDYKLKNKFTGKIKSGIKSLRLELGPTFKIVDRIKKYSAHVFLVMFKLELGISQKEMLKNARRAMQSSCADLCVVNTFSKNRYKALIVDRNKILCRADSKEELVTKLVDMIKR